MTSPSNEKRMVGVDTLTMHVSEEDAFWWTPVAAHCFAENIAQLEDHLAMTGEELTKVTAGPETLEKLIKVYNICEELGVTGIQLDALAAALMKRDNRKYQRASNSENMPRL